MAKSIKEDANRNRVATLLIKGDPEVIDVLRKALSEVFNSGDMEKALNEKGLTCPLDSVKVQKDDEILSYVVQCYASKK